MNTTRLLSILLLISARFLSTSGATPGTTFKYDGVPYTILDAQERTCQTKAGYVYKDHLYPGNTIYETMWIPPYVMYEEESYKITTLGFASFPSTILRNINLPTTITTISELCFYYCKNLKHIDLPSSVRFIGKGAFDSSGLLDIELPLSLETLANDAFIGCVELKEITIAEGNKHFSSRDGVLFNKDMSRVERFPPALEEWTYTIPDAVKTIGQNAFINCHFIYELFVPSGLEYIEDRGFYQCISIPRISLPVATKSIGEEAFAECWLMKELRLEGGLISIGSNAFSGCKVLKSVYYNTTEPVEAPDNVFPETTYTGGTLYVPQGSEAKFKALSPWKNFKTIKGYEFAGVGNVEAENPDAPVSYYNLQGQQVENTSHGVYIRRCGTKVEKVYF